MVPIREIGRGLSEEIRWSQSRKSPGSNQRKSRIPHPKWQERPLALVVLKPSQQVTVQQLREHLAAAFARWQLPDQILLVNSIPKTSVGKLNKKVIRAEYAGLYGHVADPS